MSHLFRNWLPFIFAACALVCLPSASAQVAGQNVNMVSGIKWPGGDPFLQRQNEPSMAVSTRNPMHILAGANDYRSVDLELVLTGGEETGDAWLGLFKSRDGGLTWQSTLLPGCKYLVSDCQDSNGHGGHVLTGVYDAGSDPVVRAGTNGMFYYAGLAFDRNTGASASAFSSIFVARYNDVNNNENSDPIRYIDTRVVANGNQSEFLDKPALAVDIPRAGASNCSFTTTQPGAKPTDPLISVTQNFPAGNVYVAYTDFMAATKDNSTPTHLMFSRSTDCGVTWGAPVQINTGNTTSQGSAIAVNPINGNVYVTWRQFASTGFSDAIMAAQSTNGGRSFSAPVRISTFTPFDQVTSNSEFRTNAYPSITTDMFGFVYVAFSARGLGPNGDARVVASGSLDGSHWTPPIMVDNPPKNSQTNPSGRGHQIMPAITFANGRLTLLYYDLRFDHYKNIYTSNGKGTYTPTLTPEGEQVSPTIPSKVFTPFIDDAGLTLRRHTIDLRVLQLGIFPTIALGPSVSVTQYDYGCCVTGSQDIQQFKFNVPNLPLFALGTQPFLGDYIEVVPSPLFVPNGNSWAYNFIPSVNPLFHATWTDNRDVIPPADGNWKNYTPAVPDGTSSIFQPGQTVSCTVGQEGMRNQNIYTSQITGGLIVGAPGNNKPLGTTKNPANNQTVPFQRAFAVEAQNVTNSQLNVRFTIANQPTSGKASFLQFSQLTTLDITIPALSSVSRSVFVTSTNAKATVTVNVVQIGSIGGSPTANGLSQSAVLNPDVTNPNITNPNVTNLDPTNPNVTNLEVTNPNITNPNITNPNVTNPNITNPNITNPNITNPNITNPNITNPDITNPNVTNPNITNPNITNPNITNPNITNNTISNQAIQDVSYPITNTGNTTSSYTVQIAQTGTLGGVAVQLIVNKLYQTPSASDCKPTVQTHWVTVANITNPKLYDVSVPAQRNQLGNPNITNSAPNEGSVTLAPGETAYITLRVISPTSTPVNPLALFVPVTVPQAVNTQTALANPGVTVLPPVAVPPLTITTTTLPDGVVGHAYSATLVGQGGNPGARTWTISSGSLPTGLGLAAATGVIAGTTTAAGNFTFAIQLKDTAIGTQFPQHITSPPTSFTIHVASPVSLNPGALVGTTPLTGGTQGAAYNQTILPVGGLAPVMISLTSGQASLPAGLIFNNGAITGTPTGTGLSTFTVQATDSSNPAQIFTSTYSINIVSSGPGTNGVTFFTQPQNSVGGQVLAGSPIQVKVQDSQGAVIANAHVTMAFAGTPPCAPATLGGTLTQDTNSSGIATFSDLSVDRGQIGYTLRATVSGISGTSNAFRVSGFCGVGNMNAARSNHVAVKLPNGAVLIAGGTSTAGTALVSSESHAPDGAFVPNQDMKMARSSFTGTLLASGKVLLAGGLNNSSGTPTVEIFDPGTGIFTLGTNHMANGRYQHTATLLPNGDVLIAGGASSFGSDNNNAEVYHAADGTFSALITMTSTHTGGTATLLPNGKVLIAGGLMPVSVPGGSVETAITTAELFDPSNNTFTVTGPMNIARSSHIAVLLPNGKVLVTGGVNASNMSEGSAELYDPSLGTFSATGSMTPRGDAAAAVLPNGKVLVIGGGAPQTNVAQLYDPISGSFTTIQPMLNARADFPAVLLNDGTVLATGGFSAPNTIANAELYYPDLAALSIATTTLPNGLVNVPYSAPINTIGGTTPISFSLPNANFPPGLAFTQPPISPTSDTLVGTPTAAGTYSFTEGVADSGSPQQNATQNYTVTIANPLAITTTTLPDAPTQNGAPGGTSAVPYSTQVLTTGGVGGATTFSVISGALPPSMTLNSATGAITSSNVTDAATNTYNFTIQAVSAGPPSSTTTKALSIRIVPLFFGNTSNILPSATVGSPYSTAISSAGGVPSFTYTLAFGTTPPPGLSLTTGTPSATLSGTPTASVTSYSFYVQAMDSSIPAQSYVEQFTITIGAPAAPPVASMSFSTQPTKSIGGQFISAPFPAIKAVDAGSNPVPNATITMSLPAANNPCTTETVTLGGTLTATTDATGTATFADLRLLNAGKPGFTLLATAPSAVTTTSASFLNVGSCNTTNSPHATRSGATTTLLQDGTILITGGEDSGGQVNTAEIYNPADGSFTPTTAFTPTGTNMNIARSQHTATLLNNGDVLIAAGATGVGTPTPVTNRLEIYSPGSHSFTFVSPELATARTGHTATLLPNGSSVLIAGGYDGTNPVGTAQIYQNGTLSSPINMTTPRNQPNAILLASGNVLITGGFTPAFPNGAGDNTAEIYNVFGAPAIINTFTPSTGNMTSGHVGHTSTLLNPTDGTVLIAGGENGSFSCKQTAEIYTSSSGTFASTGSMITGRCLHSATTLSNGKILMFGGYTKFGLSGASINDLYDPATQTFASDSSVQTPRAQMGAVPLSDGTVFIVGGTLSFGAAIRPAEIYYPAP
jgi:hypothetical protein